MKTDINHAETQPSGIARVLYVFSIIPTAVSVLMSLYVIWLAQKLPYSYSEYSSAESKMQYAKFAFQLANCMWASIGWLVITLLAFFLHKALYFMAVGTIRSRDEKLLDRACDLYVIPFCLLGLVIWWIGQNVHNDFLGF